MMKMMIMLMMVEVVVMMCFLFRCLPVFIFRLNYRFRLSPIDYKNNLFAWLNKTCR